MAANQSSLLVLSFHFFLFSVIARKIQRRAVVLSRASSASRARSAFETAAQRWALGRSHTERNEEQGG